MEYVQNEKKKAKTVRNTRVKARKGCIRLHFYNCKIYFVCVKEYNIHIYIHTSRFGKEIKHTKKIKFFFHKYMKISKIHNTIRKLKGQF